MSLSVSSKTTLALDHHLLQQSKHASNVELMSKTAQVPSATAARRWKGVIGNNGQQIHSGDGEEEQKVHL